MYTQYTVLVSACGIYVCSPLLYLCFQDEMELMREEHEKELQELKVDNSI